MREMIGRTLGHYRVVERIGAGGMGVVYRASDERLNRDVAVKVLHAEFALDRHRLARFEREARTIARLEHPNILTIHDFGTDDGVTYAVTELLEGESLRERLAYGPLAWHDAVPIVGAVIEGLIAAHSKGTVHRDLKPENVFLTADDRVKILDFGIARLCATADPDAETASFTLGGTMTGTIVGTIGYMSPEQATAGAVDARSDLFSLGTILYEMLAGRRPFDRDSAAATHAALLRDEPPPLGLADRRVTRLVTRCLRKDPDERFQSADALRSAIEACTDGRQRGGAGASPPSGEPRPTEASIAVFPFANLSGEADDVFLCEGLAEEIIGALTRLGGLRVIARTSSFAVGAMRLDARQAGERLGVSSILEGSVRRAGHHLRISVALVDTRDGGQLWGERYDREVVDALSLEDEVAAAIVGRLRGELAPDATAGTPRPAANVEARAQFLEGRHHLARGTPDALARAKSCFERAIEHDPGLARGFDSLAELYWYLGFFGSVPPRDAFSHGTWYALRALELDDALAETHALLAMLRKELDYNWPEVDRELRCAFELQHGSPLVRLRYAISGLLPHGKLDAAIDEVERVLETDPLSIFVRWWLSIMLYLARRPDRMIAEARHMIELDPNQFLGHWSLGVGLGELGSASEAVEALERADRLSGGMPFTLGFLAHGAGRAGRPADVRALLDRARETSATAYLPPSTIALGHVGLGDWDSAFPLWDRAIDERDPLVIPIRSFPFFDPVRSDPRYLAMLDKMNLADG